MKNALEIIELNEAVIFRGNLGKDFFEKICCEIQKIAIEDKLRWLIDILEENGFHVIDICRNAKLFGCARYIV